MEQRRVVPALDMAVAKVYFAQDIDRKECGKHMWINNVYFDGEFITGTLINELTKIKVGDIVKR